MRGKQSKVNRQKDISVEENASKSQVMIKNPSHLVRDISNNRLDINQRFDELIEYIKFLAVGNLFEAKDLIGKVQSMEDQQLDGSVLHLMRRLMEMTVKLNQKDCQVLSRTAKNAHSIIDFQKWQEMSSSDEVLDSLKTQFNHIHWLHKQLKQKSLQHLDENQNQTFSQRNQQQAKLQSFLNTLWLGKHFLEMILCKKQNDKFNFRNEMKTTIIPDPQIFNIVNECALWMKTLPSLMMFKKVFDGKMGLQYFVQDRQKQRFQLSVDKFYQASVRTFQQDMIDMLKRVLEVFKAWKSMEEKYLSQQKYMCLKGQQQAEFYTYVKKINQLSKNEVKGRFYQNFDIKPPKSNGVPRNQPRQQVPVIIQPSNNNQHIQNLSAQNQNLKRTIHELKIQHERQLNAKNEKIKQLEGSLDKANQAYQSILADLKTKQAQFKRTIGQLRSQIKNLSDTITNNEKTIQHLTKKIEAFDAEKIRMQTDFNTKTQKISTDLKLKNQQNEKLSKENQKISKDASDLKLQISNKQRQLQSLGKTIEKDQKSFETQIQLKDDQITRMDKQLKNLHSDLTKKSQDCQKMILDFKKAGRCYTQYFNGYILNINNSEQTTWFVNSLQKELKRKIKATYLLYRFDLQNKSSFHSYIDNKPQIVLIVKMKSGQIIAGYSQPGFVSHTNVNYKEGIMFSFGNRKIFTMKKQPSSKTHKTDPKPITYDDYYVIWGNSDIRIRSGGYELYSNYSTPGCSYEEKGNKNPNIADLFMQEEREAVLVDYELYQVQFEAENYQY